MCGDLQFFEALLFYSTFHSRVWQGNSFAISFILLYIPHTKAKNITILKEYIYIGIAYLGTFNKRVNDL